MKYKELVSQTIFNMHNDSLIANLHQGIFPSESRVSKNSKER